MIIPEEYIWMDDNEVHNNKVKEMQQQGHMFITVACCQEVDISAYICIKNSSHPIELIPAPKI